MSKQSVFVIDDDDSVRKAVQLILELAGHEVQAFRSAKAFLAHYEPSQSGCIVSDVRMPGMDGMQLLQELISRGAKIPILMLSAHGDIPMAVNALQIGAVDFLEKPSDPEVLRSKVAEALALDAQWRMDHEEHLETKRLLATLTTREQEVLNLLADGKDAKMIGRILGTSHNTVRVQKASIMKKMNADSAADLIRILSNADLLGD